MDMTIGQIGEVTVVLLPGKDLDAGNTADFKSAIAPVFKVHNKVVFDLSQLRFIHSSWEAPVHHDQIGMRRLPHLHEPTAGGEFPSEIRGRDDRSTAGRSITSPPVQYEESASDDEPADYQFVGRVKGESGLVLASVFFI
jgi:hypothetical protein